MKSILITTWTIFRIVFFSGSSDNRKIYFVIQDAFEREEEQEIKLGMNTFSIKYQD